MTMLTIVQQAAVEMGLSSPSTVAANTAADVVQLLGLTNAVGYELVREHDWQALTTEYRFTTVYYAYTGTSTAGSTSLTAMSSIASLTSDFMVTGDGIEEDTYVVSATSTTVVISRAASAAGTGTTFTFSQTKYATPSDFDRLVDNTEWDKTENSALIGPASGQQWQTLKGGNITSGPDAWFRMLGTDFQIWPPLGSENYLGFEYISANWAIASGTAKAAFTIDTDTCIFPDRLMVSGTKLKYFQVKGFDTTAFERDFTRQFNIAKAAEAGSATLDMRGGGGGFRLIDWANIPDSGYG